MRTPHCCPAHILIQSRLTHLTFHVCSFTKHTQTQNYTETYKFCWSTRTNFPNFCFIEGMYITSHYAAVPVVTPLSGGAILQLECIRKTKKYEKWQRTVVWLTTQTYSTRNRNLFTVWRKLKRRKANDFRVSAKTLVSINCIDRKEAEGKTAKSAGAVNQLP